MCFFNYILYGFLFFINKKKFPWSLPISFVYLYLQRWTHATDNCYDNLTTL